VLAKLHDVLTRLLAPIIPHTAEELWAFGPVRAERPASVHLALFPSYNDLPEFEEPRVDVGRLMGTRAGVLRELEALRAAKSIGSAQEALVVLGSNDASSVQTLKDYRDLLELVCIVSEVQVVADRPDGAVTSTEYPTIWILARRSPYPKCERCWNLRPSVGTSPEHPTLCERCARVLRAMKES
jgi:isoleucyl-tRNA synthetase